MLNELRKAEETYKFKKHDLEIRKANLWLNVNWNHVNNGREEIGLPKLSNQTMKEAYISSMLEDIRAEVIAAETEYNYLRRVERVEEIKLGLGEVL